MGDQHLKIEIQPSYQDQFGATAVDQHGSLVGVYLRDGTWWSPGGMEDPKLYEEWATLRAMQEM